VRGLDERPVVCGDRDPFVPPEHAAGLARQLPNGRLFVVPDCGHEVMARRPGLFNEATSAFGDAPAPSQMLPVGIPRSRPTAPPSYENDAL